MFSRNKNEIVLHRSTPNDLKYIYAGGLALPATSIIIETLLQPQHLQPIYFTATILDIMLCRLLQFQRYYIPQAELEDAFIYKIHKPINWSLACEN